VSRLRIDPEVIRELAALLEETGLNEIEVAEGANHVRVARHPAPTVAMPAMAAPAAAMSAEPRPAADAASTTVDEAGAVRSPMVGTIYVAPEPGAPPYITIGSTVAAGDTLFIIEAMKTMNPVRAPRSGRVARILATNAAPVEFGEVLVILE